METKSFWQSKIVWIGIIQTLIASLALVGEFLSQTNFNPVAVTTLVTGILTIILRIWFTDSSITK